LIRLARNTEATALAKACELAIFHGRYTMKYLEHVIKNKTYADTVSLSDAKPLPPHANIRGREYYQNPTAPILTNNPNPTSP
jgi:hypothetical protein